MSTRSNHGPLTVPSPSPTTSLAYISRLAPLHHLSNLSQSYVVTAPYDINAQFNNAVDWYYGTVRSVPPDLPLIPRFAGRKPTFQQVRLRLRRHARVSSRPRLHWSHHSLGHYRTRSAGVRLTAPRRPPTPTRPTRAPAGTIARSSTARGRTSPTSSLTAQLCMAWYATPSRLFTSESHILQCTGVGKDESGVI